MVLRRLLYLLCMAAFGVPLVATADSTKYDGLQELIHHEATQALHKGDYARAEYLFWRLTYIDPNDAAALREAGRTAVAMGDFRYAVDALARVNELQGRAADPEIHYLRAQALLALNQKDEADKELAQAELELAPMPPDRISALWLGRIYALRGDLPRSVETYLAVMSRDRLPEQHHEVVMYIAEAHILSKEWAGAERVLRQFLEYNPGNARARDLLAWVLEARGRTAEEIAVRTSLTREPDERPARVLGLARALERAQDYPEALRRYREAHALQAADLSSEIQRLDLRLSPELSAGMVRREDPSGATQGFVAGVSVPIRRGLRLGLVGVRETTTQDLMEDVSLTAGSLSATYSRRGWTAMAGGTVSSGGPPAELGVGGQVQMRTPANKRLELHVQGDLHMPWREAASTIRERGTVDSIGLQLYTTPLSRRLIFSGGGYLRRLDLSPTDGTEVPHATQLFGFGGVDFVLWQNPKKTARGEVLDEDHLWPTHLAPAVILGYRHYELTSDDPFGMRLVLVERSRIDEASAILRQVFGSRGPVAVELRGGLGYDWARSVRMWRAGGAVLLSAVAAARLTGSFDIASQTGTGLSGLRHTGWVTFHVDL